MDQKDSISEIERLLDELESYAEKSPFWVGSRVLIPDEAFFMLIQQIRELLPQELADARKTIEKRDLILKNAQEEHKRIIESAERRLEDLTSEESVVQVARERANQLIDEARSGAENIKRDALSYTVELLQDMEEQFQKTLLTVQNGRQFVEAEINQQVTANLSAVSDVVEGSEEKSPGEAAAEPARNEE